jgi:hypothetical protein
LKVKQRRFSDQQLFAIRNHIPIKIVIDNLLHIPSKISQGTYRFCCPICREYNTAINRQTNLARCFICEKNFNPIDMVMTVGNINFVETVNLLKKFADHLHHKEIQTPQKSDSTASPTLKTASKLSENPVAVGDILSQHIKTLQTDSLQPLKTDPPSQKQTHIANIERDIQLLSQQIEQLKTLIYKLQSK